jgi:putative flippase GtrA
MKRVGSFINKVTSFGGRLPIYLTRLFRSSVSGGLAFAFDILLLYVFVEFLHIYYLISAGGAFVIAHSSNYVVQRMWGFRGTKANLFGGYLCFALFGSLGIILTVGLLAVAVEIFSLNYLLGRVLVSLIVGLLLFILNYIFTFKMGCELPNPFK